MKISVNGCVYRTESLPKELLNKPEFKKAIEKAEKRAAELKSLNEIPEIEVKKANKKQEND